MRSGIGPLNYSDDNFVSYNQSMAKMLNKYFSSIFITTCVDNCINANDISTNDVNSSTSILDKQDATTEPCDNSNVSVSNNNEYRYVLDLQNRIYDNVISSNHTLLNLQIYTEDILNAINNVKPNNLCQTIFILQLLEREKTRNC